MDFIFRKRNRTWVIIAFWVLIAIVLTTRSALGQLHANGSVEWLQNFFFQGSGILVWAVLTPFLIRFTKRHDLTSDRIWHAFVAHLLLSIPLAIMHRTSAMLLDFTIRDLVGMGFFDSWNPFEMIYRFRFMIISSSIANFLCYWILITGFSSIIYYRKVKAKRVAEQEHGQDQFAEQFKVKIDGVYKLITIADIVSCEASGNYITLFTNTDKYRVRETMNNLEARLGKSFVRVHRSSIVNMQFLESFEHLYQGEYLLKLSNGKQLTSTKSYRGNLMPLLSNVPV